MNNEIILETESQSVQVHANCLLALDGTAVPEGKYRHEVIKRLVPIAENPPTP